MYKVWHSTSSWLTMPYETMQARFRTGSRYDVLGNWPAHICATGLRLTSAGKSLAKTSELAQTPEAKWMIFGWSNDSVRTKFFQHLLVDPSKWVTQGTRSILRPTSAEARARSRCTTVAWVSCARLSPKSRSILNSRCFDRRQLDLPSFFTSNEE